MRPRRFFSGSDPLGPFSDVSPVEVEAVARAMRHRCVQWARRSVRDGAEDVAQAALEALVRHASAIERSAAVAWLQRAVQLQALQYLKARGDEHRSDEAPERADAGPDPEHALAAAEVGARVQQALAGIDPQRRAMVVAVLLEGRSVVEAAREQRIALGTAHTRLHAGTAELREQLVRMRMIERRRSKGSTSWGVVPVWWDGPWRRAGRALIQWGPALVLAVGLGADSPPVIGPVADELPVRAFESEPLQVVTALPRAERGAPLPRMGERGARRMHDAPARMLRERVAQGRR